MALQTFPIPAHFNPESVQAIWRVPYQDRAEDAQIWAEQYNIRPVGHDKTRVCLLLIDCQNTFCMPDFELFVAGRSGNGAVEDNIRLCEFMYRHLGIITDIIPTMDTHTTLQIFHPVFWVDDQGQHPVGGQTIITYDEVQNGAWRVNPDVATSPLGNDYGDLSLHALHYVKRLTEGGKYPLMIWPYHAMLGGIGHALVPAVEEALFFHSIARTNQVRFEIKGNNPLTEHYSALRPEVSEGANGQPIGKKNTDLLNLLKTFDMVIIAGQAKSHCVTWTVDDLLADIHQDDEMLANRIYLLEDCTSPVVIPGIIDFTDQANEAYQRFQDAGIHVVKSTDSVESWPGVEI